jgi:hypothetical protein
VQGIDFRTAAASDGAAAPPPRTRRKVHLAPELLEPEAAKRRSAADGDSGAEGTYARARRSSLGIWEEKKRLIRRNETVMVLDGSLQRAPRNSQTGTALSDDGAENQPGDAADALAKSAAAASQQMEHDTTTREDFSHVWIDAAERRGLSVDGGQVRMAEPNIIPDVVDFSESEGSGQGGDSDVSTSGRDVAGPPSRRQVMQVCFCLLHDICLV